MYNSIPHSYFKSADHFILVFDPADHRSEIQKPLQYWLDSVANNNKIADKITIIANNKGDKNAHDFENANATEDIVKQEITKFKKDYEQTPQHRFFRIDNLKNDDETSLQALNVKNIKSTLYFLFLQGIFQNIMEDFANNVDEFIKVDNVDTNNVQLDKEPNSKSSWRCC